MTLNVFMHLTHHRNNMDTTESTCGFSFTVAKTVVQISPVFVVAETGRGSTFGRNGPRLCQVFDDDRSTEPKKRGRSQAHLKLVFVPCLCPVAK